AELYRRMAAAWNEQLHSGAQAAECLEWLLAFEGPSPGVLAALERIYRGEHRWRPAIDAYTRHAAIVPAVEQAELFVEVAGIFEREIQDCARAIDYYIKADEALPGHGVALAGLSRPYEQAWQRSLARPALGRAAHGG